jgi:serine/threonine protein kinase/tetratricopeptide (TPR) repeat protein
MSIDADRVKAIFVHAIEKVPAEGWEGYLDGACADQPELRQEVARLLTAHAQSGALLDKGPLGATVTVAHSVAPLLGAQIDKYKLLEQIGEGGYGVVFMAEQQTPVHRRVALKLIKPGMDSRQVLARFEAERQALAMMDHPNIAKVFDGGVTDQGRPYFVMEYVKGIPVTEYCDKACLSIQDRLLLFLPVCQAVQHAHQKGIIHRDLKPSNVLICLYDGKPVPKVIDFGLAKAMHQSLTEHTLFTAHGQMVGTPLYMSPEQAEFNNLDIDTRTDVYSLGIMLYELLTGSPPLESERLQRAAWQEVLRLIKEEDAPTPSSRLSSSGSLPTIAAQRGAEPAQLGRAVRGDLDWIVMKALEKDRGRRYESASALAADLSRHLANEPVEAAAPSRTYRLRKFVRRNKRSVIASAAMLAALVAGVVGTTIGLVGEARQRAEAEKQAAIADAVSQFQAEMLASADPNRMLGDKVTVLQAIQAAVKELDAGRLKDQPLVEARVREVIGVTLNSLGHYDEAKPNLERGLALQTKSQPESDPARADYLFSLAVLARSQGKYAEAEDLYRQALEIRRQSLPESDPSIWASLSNLAEVMRLEGKLDEAEALARQAVDLARQAPPTAQRDVAPALHALAVVLQTRGRPAEAEPLYRDALAINRRVLPEGHPEMALYLGNLATVLSDQGKFAEAEPLYREVIEVYRQNLPADHPEQGKVLSNLALLLDRQGQAKEAERLARKALEIHRKALRADDPELAGALNNLGTILMHQGQYADAVPYLRESLDIIRQTPPPGFPFTANVLNNLAETLLGNGKPAESEPLFREALVALEQTGTNERWKFGITRQGLGRSLAALERRADAEAELLEAERILAAEPVMARGYRQKCIAALAALYTSWDEAAPGKGYDDKARQWKARLDGVQPDAAPAGAHASTPSR